MALAARPAIQVTIEYIDITGSSGKSVAHLPATTTLADAITKTEALIAALKVVSDAFVAGYSISYAKTELTTVAAGATSRVENKAKFKLRTAAAKQSIFSVPSPTASVVSLTGGIVTTDTNVAAMIAALTGGWCDSNGSLLQSLIADEQVFASTTKRQMTTDTTPAS